MIHAIMNFDMHQCVDKTEHLLVPLITHELLNLEINILNQFYDEYY